MIECMQENIGIEEVNKMQTTEAGEECNRKRSTMRNSKEIRN